MQLYRKCIKRGLAAFVLVLILANAVYYAQATESTEIDQLERERQETIDAINNLKNSIDDVQDDIDQLKAEKGTIQTYISQLDKEISNLTSEITKFEEQIEEKKADIKKTQKELETAQKACEEQYEAMKKRIQFMYENPGGSLAELLLGAGNMTELINRADYASFISSYDRTMMEKLQATQDEVTQKEEALTAELEQLELMQTEIEAQKTKVNASINTKKGELSANTSKLGDAAAAQSDYEKQLVEQERLLGEIEDQIAKAANPDAYEGGTSSGFIWPCPSYKTISSYFGARPQPVPGASTNHKGVDLSAPYGSAILAVADGVVTTSTYSSSAGNYIVIAHGDGLSTVYMHASALLVSVGEKVSQGQTIAKVGSTGYSSGNHLHFGVIKNGTYVDPLGYISP